MHAAAGHHACCPLIHLHQLSGMWGVMRQRVIILQQHFDLQGHHHPTYCQYGSYSRVLSIYAACIFDLLFCCVLTPVMTVQDDFGHLHPLNPAHYLRICMKSYTAMKNNNFKIAEKDL